MPRWRLLRPLVLAFVLCACQPMAERRADRLPVQHLRLPQGFAVEVWATVPGARSLALARDGRRVHVGTNGSEVFAVLDPERDGVANEVVRVAEGLEGPSAVAVGPGGALFIVERHRIIRISPEGKATVVVPDGVLAQTGDGARAAAFGPDGRLYVGIGARCDGCTAGRFQNSIIRLRPDGHDLEVFARGAVNPGGFDWEPLTGAMFFTDASGTGSGERMASGELNRAPQRGLNFGRPAVQARSLAERGSRAGRLAREVARPVMEFDPPGMPLGIEFYDGAMFPAAYREDAFVVQQGSPDRLGPAGHRVMQVHFLGGAPGGKEVFLDGWLTGDGTAWGRPVDLEELPDGSLLIADDLAGVIYRITYGG